MAEIKRASWIGKVDQPTLGSREHRGSMVNSVDCAVMHQASPSAPHRCDRGLSPPMILHLNWTVRPHFGPPFSAYVAYVALGKWQRIKNLLSCAKADAKCQIMPSCSRGQLPLLEPRNGNTQSTHLKTCAAALCSVLNCGQLWPSDCNVPSAGAHTLALTAALRPPAPRCEPHQTVVTVAMEQAESRAKADLNLLEPRTPSPHWPPCFIQNG
jgi:hypothetical protein